MSEKTCFKCLKTLPLESFYKHSQMSQGRMNKCIECTKNDVKKHRQENLEKIRAYDKFRSGLAHRVSARKEYAKTQAGKAAHKKALAKYREMHPERTKARSIVRYALVKGQIKKHPCLICGCVEVEGHHPDYDRPLDVVWLCAKHHKETHNF